MSDVIKVAANAAKVVMVQAKGNPAQIIAVGVASALTFIGVGLGYGLYRGGEKMLELVNRD